MPHFLYTGSVHDYLPRHSDTVSSDNRKKSLPDLFIKCIHRIARSIFQHLRKLLFQRAHPGRINGIRQMPVLCQPILCPAIAQQHRSADPQPGSPVTAQLKAPHAKAPFASALEIS